MSDPKKPSTGQFAYYAGMVIAGFGFLICLALGLLSRINTVYVIDILGEFLGLPGTLAVYLLGLAMLLVGVAMVKING